MVKPVLRSLPLTAKTAPSDKAEILPKVHPGRGCGGLKASQGQVKEWRAQVSRKRMAIEHLKTDKSAKTNFNVNVS